MVEDVRKVDSLVAGFAVGAVIGASVFAAAFIWVWFRSQEDKPSWFVDIQNWVFDHYQAYEDRFLIGFVTGLLVAAGSWSAA